MLSSYFSWLAKSSLEKKAPKTEGPQDDDRLSKPTTAEYISVTGKEILDVLEDVAQTIPIPGVGAAVKLATNIIKACEETHATSESADELKERIQRLIMVVINELKEKTSDEIGDKHQEDMYALQRELKYIEKQLNGIASQNALFLVFYRSLYDDKVKKCMSRLDGLVERFNITQEINHTELLDHLTREIVRFHEAQKQTLDEIRKGMDTVNENVAAILKRDTRVASSSSSTSLRAAIPAPNGLFYGRDVIVSNLVAHLTSPDAQNERHICIFGPGGMGKTATALAVMAHPSVKECYPGGRGVWVPCVKATSIAILFGTLASSLGITRTEGSLEKFIFSELKKSAEPLVLLLDNFETPWNVDGKRSEVEQILRDIDQMPHVTLFLTMRSSDPPCSDLSWHSKDLRPVDAGAAQQIYSKIYSDSSADSQMTELLQLIGNMPLAITLMATSAKNSKLSAKHLIDQYNKTGTTMLSQGSDPEHSMDICISLSVDSPPMKRNPDAQRLLDALSMLPAGTTYEMLTTWWAPSLLNLTGALQILRETSLLEVRGSSYSVLPVIQRYILNASRFDVRVRDSMITSACKFFEKHSSLSPGKNGHKESMAVLAAEEGNLEAVLMQTVTPSPEVMNALLALAQYQASARPRTNIIKHALTLAREMGDKHTHGAVLQCYGIICYNLGRYEDSWEHFNAARDLFLSVSNMKRAAWCLLGRIDSYQPDSPIAPELETFPIDQAEAEFKSIGDELGIAHCGLSRGKMAYKSRKWDEAVSLFHHARHTFTEIREHLMSARCSDEIAMCHYHREDFEESKVWSERAVQEYDRLGAPGDKLIALLGLGCKFNALGDHLAARESMKQCLEMAKAFSAPVIVGYVFEEMGIAWMQLGGRIEAKNAFQEALKASPPGKNGEDHARYHYWLRKVEDSNAVPTPEEWWTLRDSYPPKALSLFGVKAE